MGKYKELEIDREAAVTELAVSMSEFFETPDGGHRHIPIELIAQFFNEEVEHDWIVEALMLRETVRQCLTTQEKNNG
tara:strand:+ start:211 stop:441 length:231 start_codon:yes stop_codon:yes gene_type:complete